jgi:glutaredoxin
MEKGSGQRDAHAAGEAMKLKLYVKTWCPWCVRAQEYLDERGFAYELIDVEADRKDYDEMIRLSGQRYTPTLDAGGAILPDFGPDELEEFLEEQGLRP